MSRTVSVRAKQGTLTNAERARALGRGAVEVIATPELEAKLSLDRPLRIKLGMDPTAPDLHLGHTLTLKKLRDFQSDGHTVIFLVGDFTAMIGDPTGRSETRKPLTRAKKSLANAETYRAQAYRILDPDRTEVRFNSEWMGEMGVSRLIELAAKLSVARMLERDDFEKRLEAGEPLFLHELLYPLIQALRLGRAGSGCRDRAAPIRNSICWSAATCSAAIEQQPQVVMTMPLLEGLDGVRKMSKSLGNYVGITEIARRDVR